MLTKTGRTVLGGGLAFALGGLLFGNWPFFGAGALLLILVGFAGLSRAPHVTRSVDTARVERGGRIRVTLDVEAPRGLGVVEIHQELPEEFELVEGNNFHLLTLGMRPRRIQWTFTARCPKRGEWELPPVGLRLVHPLGLSESPPMTAGEPFTLLVTPRPVAATIPRDMRTRARRPFPDGDAARMGVATNEFRELREYVPGDPPRRINWKATARRIGSGASEVPLVNQTEWEGKKMVWIIVDGHPRLSVGTNIEDARERAADAALSLMEQYLRRGYQVGLAIARAGKLPSLSPGTGEAQIRRARDLLSRIMEPASIDSGPSLMAVLTRDAAHFHRGRPLVVLVTRLAQDDDDLRAAMVRIGALGRMNGRNIVPGLVVDLEPAALVVENMADEVASQALASEQLSMRAAARAVGLRVTAWRVDDEPLTAILARGRIA